MKSFAGIIVTIVCVALGFLSIHFFEKRAVWKVIGEGTSVELKAENEKLMSELATLKAQVCTDNAEDGMTHAAIFAEYPWNNKELIVVDKGELQGIAEGMPVFSESGFVIGKVVSVRKNTAQVETVFDPAWKSSVAIGEGGVHAVLSGGAELELTLIPGNAAVKRGDSITNTSPELPLYAPIGEIDTVDMQSEDVWKNARISVPYDIGSMTNVLIRTDFP